MRAALKPVLESTGDDPFVEGSVGEAFDDGEGVIAATSNEATDAKLTSADGTDMEMENDPEKDNRALFHLSSTTGDGEAMTKSYHLPLTHDPNRSRQAPTP